MNELTVNEKYRGQGIGKYLFEFVIKKGREFKVQSIDLTVAEFNQSAIEFYKNIGMKTRSKGWNILLADSGKTPSSYNNMFTFCHICSSVRQKLRGEEVELAGQPCKAKWLSTRQELIAVLD